MDNNKNNKIKRKKILATAIIIISALLVVMLLLSELILPKISQSVNKGNSERSIETRIFVDGDSITEQELLGYEQCVTDIFYKTNGIETLVTDGRFYEIGGNAAVMFSEYIKAIKNGDHEAYKQFFSPKYDSENGLDRFASGKYEFSPQRLYDIHIECLDQKYDEQSGLTLGLFCVTYKIYLNTGDFRNDITDDTAPLIFVTEEDSNGVVKITDVAYRYGN